ncbi:MAG TPA: VOC family protein [Actinocatenispora sp.]
MSDGMTTILYPVTDLDAAKATFRALLGVEPAQDTPYYVGFEVGGQTIGLDPGGHQRGMRGGVGYVEVDDIAGRLQALLAAGAETVEDVHDVGGGKLIASVRDADGNVLGLMQTP